MIESAVDGVRYLQHQRHGDSRGAFREIWRASAFGPIVPAYASLFGGDPSTIGDSAKFVQANLSSSERGVLRGLHLHTLQLDFWTVLAGKAFLALVDVRPLVRRTGSRAIVETRIMGPDDAVVIPAGVAHGFLAIDPVDLLYLVTNEYDGSDELGFAWDDPEVGVPWPSVVTPHGDPILSARDRSNPLLAELLISLRD